MAGQLPDLGDFWQLAANQLPFSYAVCGGKLPYSWQLAMQFPAISSYAGSSL
jgi:hypothetical protein